MLGGSLVDIWWILQPPPVKRNYNGWEGVRAHPKNNPTQKKGTGRDGARAKKAQNQPTTTRGGTGGDGTGRDGTGDTHMMMKSGVVFFMCCFPMLCYFFFLLCGFSNCTAARSKLALGVPVILPPRKRDLPHYMALAVNPVFTGITLGLDDGSAYFVIDPPIAVSPKTNRKLWKLLIQS